MFRAHMTTLDENVPSLNSDIVISLVIEVKILIPSPDPLIVQSVSTCN